MINHIIEVQITRTVVDDSKDGIRTVLSKGIPFHVSISRDTELSAVKKFEEITSVVTRGL